MRRSLLRASRWRCGQCLLLVLLSTSPTIAGPRQLDPKPAPAAASNRDPATVVKVTWSDIVQLVDQHPRVAAGKFQVDAARSSVDVAGAVPNPTLAGTVGHSRARTGDASRVEWGLALSIPFGWVAQRRSRIDAAHAEVDVAVAEGKSLRRDVLLQLGSLFWNLAYEQARVSSLETLEARNSELVLTVKKRVDKGEVRPVEVTRVEIELEKVTGELESARTSRSSGQEQLARWLGVPRGKPIVVDADLNTLPVAMDRDRAVAKARAFHPELAATKARMRSLEFDVGAEKMARIPSFVLTGFTAYELDRRAYGVGLAVDVPIWNWNSGRIAHAEAKLAAGRKLTEATAVELETAVIDAQAACHASVASATRLRNNVVPRSETAASTMERTYQLGETSLLETIDARRTLLDSHRLYLSALAQAHIDCSHLGALVGDELP